MRGYFLSRRTRRLPEGCDSGTVTVYDRGYGVLGEGELRGIGLSCPGGYLWRPALGDRVLVVKGSAGTAPSVIGAAPESSAPDLEAGEVRIFSQSSSICLKNDGTILLEGLVDVEGLLRVNGLPVMGLPVGGESQ